MASNPYIERLEIPASELGMMIRRAKAFGFVDLLGDECDGAIWVCTIHIDRINRRVEARTQYPESAVARAIALAETAVDDGA